MLFKREDLSQYNTAKSPWFDVAINGKVDIGIEQGYEQKVSLSVDGMHKLVMEWLNSNHHLTTDQREELIEKLKK